MDAFKTGRDFFSEIREGDIVVYKDRPNGQRFRARCITLEPISGWQTDLYPIDEFGCRVGSEEDDFHVDEVSLDRLRLA